MKLSEIVKIEQTSSQSEANNLLDSGWVLLSAGFHRGEAPGYDYHSYSLGLPKGVTPPPAKPKRNYDGIDF